ncbi:MAG: caspase family protein [Planctomycetaceae bacterium]|nr:caspase family protein [Planctomycetaceae bacterium]
MTMLSSFTFAAEIPQQQMSCLLVGIANPSKMMDVLESPYKDVKDMADAARREGYDHIDVLTDKKSKVYRIAFLNQLRQISQRKKQKVLMVYFTGHGVWLNGKSYIVLNGADISRPETTLVSFDEIYAILKTSDALSKVVLLDCCQTPPKETKPQIIFTAKGFAKGVIDDVPQGFLVMTGSSEGQPSVEKGKEGSIFTQNFLKSSLFHEFSQVQKSVQVEYAGQTPQMIDRRNLTAMITLEQSHAEVNSLKYKVKQQEDELKRVNQQNRELKQQQARSRPNESVRSPAGQFIRSPTGQQLIRYGLSRIKR